MDARSLLGRILLCGSTCWPFPAQRVEAAAGRSAEPGLRAVVPRLAEPLARDDVSQALTPVTVEEGSIAVPAPDAVTEAPLQPLPLERTVLEVAAEAQTSPPTSFVASAAEPKPDSGVQEQRLLSKASDGRLGIPVQRETAEAVREGQSSGRDPAAGWTASAALFDFMILHPPGGAADVFREQLADEPAGKPKSGQLMPSIFLRQELHDIQDPLAGAIGWLDLLKEKLGPPAPNEPSKPLLAHARDQAWQALSLLTRFQSQARPWPKQVPLEPVLALADALGDSIGWASRLAAESPVPRDADGAKRLMNAQKNLAKVAARVAAMAEAGRRLGRISVSWERADARSILESSLSYWQSAGALKGVEVTVEPGPGLPEVALDPALTARALDNLVANAVKFAAIEARSRGAQGGAYVPRVAVRARLGRDLDEGYVVVEVADNGPGIAAQDLPRIFEAGFQSGPRAHREAGTGLGLSIVREYARAQNGEVRVESELGRGSVFSLRLRIAGP